MILMRSESIADMRTRHRLFFAVKPPPPVAALIGQLRDAGRAGRSRVTDERLHITMFITDNYPALPADLADRMGETASSIDLPAARVAFDRLIGGRHSTLLAPSEPVRGLEGLQERLGFALSRVGIAPRPRWRFSPHITLCYSGGADFDREIDPISWKADEIVLIHSLAGIGRHITLGRWSLAA